VSEAGTRRGFLLLRRAGGLWGVANGAVLGLARWGADFRIAVDGGALIADEILGVVEDLVVRPMAPVVGRFWPEASAGWAVHAETPLVVVDPSRPPSALAMDQLGQPGQSGHPGEGEA
jgi:hypothetical protein